MRYARTNFREYVLSMQLLGDAGNVGQKKSEGILLCLSRQRTCTSLVKKNEKVKALSPQWEAFAPSNGHRRFGYSMTLRLFCLIFCSKNLRRQPSIIQKKTIPDREKPTTTIDECQKIIASHISILVSFLSLAVLPLRRRGYPQKSLFISTASNSIIVV